ncbi:MAG: MFS transporter, partial [Hyphomicrobiales bacterium]|nr:MFS transporter [Hyphomicrobiales bacterium]
ADATGPRKPWIAAFSIVIVIASATLWLAEPGAPNAAMIALIAFALGTVAVEFAIVFTNAMMPDLVPPERLGRLSGTGWAVGYIGGMISLILVLGFLAARPETGLTLLGFEPLFGLDPETGAGDRTAGPFTAIWYVIFIAPLFLFTPDVARRRDTGSAVAKGLAELRQTIAALPGLPNLALYLLAHMVYVDGLVALFAFGGIYAAGQFGWSTVEIGLFGILLTITGTIGAFVGGRLDDRFGPKNVVLVALALLTAAAIGILSLDASTVAFVIAVAPPASDAPSFSSAPEIAYLALGGVIGAAAGPLQSASRTLLVALAPRDRLTQMFGLYALSGKLTSFIGPLAVGLVTAVSGSQRIGISVLIAFFVAGIALLLPIRTEKAVPTG